MRMQRKPVASRKGRMRIESAATMLGVSEHELWRRPIVRAGGRAIRHGTLQAAWAGDWGTLRNLMRERWRVMAARYHPDGGGCPRVAAEINAAHQWIQRRINQLDPWSVTHGRG